MGEHDIESALRDGYFKSSRASNTNNTKSSESYRKPYLPPRDALSVPRTANLAIARPTDWTTRFPPPPSVEDESDALAREVGPILSSGSPPSEEPAHRGDPEQNPIILPVHEYNPERRFVLVSNQSDGQSDSTGNEPKPARHRGSNERLAEPDPEPDFYEANTGRKYESHSPPDERASKKKDSRHDGEKQRSKHEDLPRIKTDGDVQRHPESSQLGKSSTRSDAVDGPYRPPSQPASGRPGHGSLLTPEVTEHATRGRDRSYHRGSSGSSPQRRDRSSHPDGEYHKSLGAEHRSRDRDSRSSHPPSRSPQKRHTTGMPEHSRRYSRRAPGSPPRFVDESARRPERRAAPPLIDHDSSPQRTSGPRERPLPPQHHDVFYSSEDEPRAQRADHRRRKSALPTSRTEHLNTPTESWSAERQKPRGPAPLPSPAALDTYASSSSRSATFPREQNHPHDNGSAARPLSRASTSRGSSSVVRPPNIIADRTLAPPGPRPNPAMEPRALPPTPSASATIPAPSQPTWQPAKFEPEASTMPLTSYRRYSAEQQQHVQPLDGSLPDIPACPRTREEAGHMDWLTLPRCDNFNICPSCYSANFASTEFAHDFVLAPFRPSDRPLACDFGASEYYRIAWLFTRKYRRPDLGLLHALTRVASPCVTSAAGSNPDVTGGRPVWYGVRDPRTGRAVDNFAVCHACAVAVETLLPQSHGYFGLLDPTAGHKNGVCAFASATAQSASSGPDAHADATATSSAASHMRFLLYFDVLEGSADRALETRTPPNMQAVADRVRELSIAPPCPQGQPVRNAMWHTMRSVPGLTVCPECFVAVVRPILDDRDKDRDRDRDLVVVGDFYTQPTTLPDGDCMLFSPRMRTVFARAVRNRDLRYLAMKVRERVDKERECSARLQAVQRQRQEAGGGQHAWADAEVERIVREWKKYE